MEKEIWKRVTLKDGTKMPYKVSNLGRIISEKTGKELHTKPNPNGFMPVTLRDGAIKQVDYAHRIVARAFIQQNIPKDVEVVHRDGNRDNNAADNLELRPKSIYTLERNYAGVDKGLDKIISIAEDLVHNNGTLTEIARRHNVDRRVVDDIYKGRTYSSLLHDYDFSNYKPISKDVSCEYLKFIVNRILLGQRKKDIISWLRNNYGFSDNEAEFAYHEGNNFAKMVERGKISRDDSRLLEAAYIDELVRINTDVDKIVTEYMDAFTKTNAKKARNKVYSRISKVKSFIYKKGCK